MTVKELSKIIGKKFFLTVESNLKIPVEVIDVKQAYGKSLFLIVPLQGNGQKWISEDRLNISY